MSSLGYAEKKQSGALRPIPQSSLVASPSPFLLRPLPYLPVIGFGPLVCAKQNSRSPPPTLLDERAEARVRLWLMHRQGCRAWRSALAVDRSNPDVRVHVAN